MQREGGRFDEPKVQFYVAEIILALDFLHKANIIYRCVRPRPALILVARALTLPSTNSDLKPENCLLDGSGHVILCDFGLSKLLTSSSDRARTLCGTTAFTAPEVLLDVGYTYTCDWWSLGVLIFEMCYGWSPFYAETQVEEYERILSGEIKIPVRKGYSAEGRDLLLKVRSLGLVRRLHVARGAYSLLCQLLERDPADRISATAIQSHPFFSTISWTRLAARQVSPPWKPPTHADEDQCDYHDLGRSGAWMFDGDGQCWSRRGSAAEGQEGEGLECDAGLFRDFTYTGEHAPRVRRESFSEAP